MCGFPAILSGSVVNSKSEFEYDFGSLPVIVCTPNMTLPEGLGLKGLPE